MSGRRYLAIGVLLLLWIMAVAAWTIGIGYEAGGFRLPDPLRDRAADILFFYGPLAAIVWLVLKPIRRKLIENAPNH